MKRALLRIGGLLLLGGGLVLGAVAMYQDRLLYYPDNPPRATLLAEAAARHLLPWPSGAEYRGLLRTPAVAPRCTLVLFHGNAGHAGDRAWYADAVGELGCRVLLAEYPGYGGRPGELGEASLVADARATVTRLRSEFPGPLIVAGESLGAGVAAAVAGASGAEALLLITPWDSLRHVAAHHYPGLPLGWVLRDRYDSAANLAAYRGRVAVVVAAQDSIVPSRFGQALFAGLNEPKRLWMLPGAEHNDWAGRVDAAWWVALLRYLLPP